jgi:anti-sigma B factor antagonist
MRLESELLDDHMVKVALDGRLDVLGTQAIDMKFTALTATKKAAILVDMTNVSFLASIGMRTLLSCAKAAANRGGKMVLLNPQPLVKDVLDRSGVAILIPLYGGSRGRQGGAASDSAGLAVEGGGSQPRLGARRRRRARNPLDQELCRRASLQPCCGPQPSNAQDTQAHMSDEPFWIECGGADAAVSASLPSPSEVLCPLVVSSRTTAGAH